MLRKFASAEILEVKHSSNKQRISSLDHFADYDDFRTADGYLYTRVRAISSRVNKNHDGWPAEELAKSYRTFIGKPIFVDHHNSDPQKARGVIVDAKLHVEDLDKVAKLDPYYATAPESHRPPTWVELLLEVDAKQFPKLAKAIIEKEIDGVSMGANVERSKCSHCSNWATSPDEYCQHIRSKGAHFDTYDDHGHKVSAKSYEDCYDIGFFEISYVFDPADETALVREVRSAVHHEADRNPLPQSELTIAPDKVDTLRQETMCPICGSDMDNGMCAVCNYEEPPQGFDNPDLQRAKEVDQEIHQQQSDDAAQGVPTDQQQGVAVPPPAQGQPAAMPVAAGVTSKDAPSAGVISGENTQTHTAAANNGQRINTQERPILPVTRQNSDRPQNAKVVSDSTKPVESKTRGDEMPENHKHADGATADGGADVQPKTRVDVLGIGAVDDNPLADITHENVEKEQSIEAIHTDTWGAGEGDALGQQDPVTNSTGDLITVSKEAAEFLNENHGEQIDLMQPIAEEVGDPTKTFPFDDMHVGEPVTQENGNDVGGPMGEPIKAPLSRTEVRAHVLKSLRVAEVEADLGMIDPATKFERAAELEDESSESLDARIDSYSRVKRAGLNKQARKQSGVGRMPQLSKRVAMVDPSQHAVADQSVEDAGVFL